MLLQTLDAGPAQIQCRQQETEHHRHQPQTKREPGRATVQGLRLHRARTLPRGITLPAPAIALQRDQQHDDRQHPQRNLRCARQITARHPGRIDRHRQGLHAEELGRADVVEGFQQCQRHSDRDRRAGQRQRHPPQQRATRHPERTRRIQQTAGLGQEHRARGQVDIRIQHHAQQQDAAGQRADVRQAEITRAVDAQQRTDQRLHRTKRVQQIQIGVGDDVGRHRQRQQQRPGQHAAATEIVGRHQPGAAGAQRRHQHADTEQQHHGIQTGARQYVRHHVRPQALAALHRSPQQRQQRQRHQHGDQAGAQRPATITAPQGGSRHRNTCTRWLRDRIQPDRPVRLRACGWPRSAPAAADRSSTRRSWPPPDPAQPRP